MKIRTTTIRVAMVGLMAGTVLALGASPAPAVPDNGCSEEWAGVTEAQEGMSHATTQYEFWTWFRAWQTRLSTISKFC